eukprot:CAMPEP_0196728056 /NCGR_PEP_ID=MMETSP1091-20130531/8865_1 /TAXON_ID=302021 /ORGANISM="Rhodomonas sp., Strain CCMP768" /LENGTH=390 /DNA_ID=CAMNT_0042070757 /DNA_START=24 /DNA_END=1197 /DNA_ORIENTATION=+
MESNLSVDLLPFAKQQIALLGAVHIAHVQHRSLYSGRMLQVAIQKYRAEFLPDLERMLRGDMEPYHPALDVCWVWHLHRMNPVSYNFDCVQAFGRVLDASAILNPFKFDEMQDWMRTAPCFADYAGVAVSSDLAACAQKQSTFFWQIRWLEHDESNLLQRAEQAYVQMLSRNNTGTATSMPTYDVELIWHTHVAFPEAYAFDTARISAKHTTPSRAGPFQAGITTTSTQASPPLDQQPPAASSSQLEHATVHPSAEEPKQSSITRAELEAILRSESEEHMEALLHGASDDAVFDITPEHTAENDTRAITTPLIAAAIHVETARALSLGEEGEEEEEEAPKARCCLLSCFMPTKRGLRKRGKSAGNSSSAVLGHRVELVEEDDALSCYSCG